MTPETTDAIRMPIVAESSRSVPEKASAAMNMDMVKPMPPSQAQPCSAVQATAQVLAKIHISDSTNARMSPLVEALA